MHTFSLKFKQKGKRKKKKEIKSYENIKSLSYQTLFFFTHFVSMLLLLINGSFKLGTITSFKKPHTFFQDVIDI